MNKKTAYGIVLGDLLRHPMFVGHYDAKNGNKHFMYGIQTVMEFIAYSVDDNMGDVFENLFLENLIESEKNA